MANSVKQLSTPDFHWGTRWEVMGEVDALARQQEELGKAKVRTFLFCLSLLLQSKLFVRNIMFFVRATVTNRYRLG